ncbi:MAG: phospho-sugar mutase [Candidatus Tectimicrobiota bacterium]
MQPLVQQVVEGFRSLPVAETARQTALTHLVQWLTEAPFVPYRPQLEWLIQRAQWSLLLDSFYRVLPFGTGGRRGPVGIGTNRFNTWTLAASVQGHVAYLQERSLQECSPQERSPRQDLSVVIAYDVRVFNDLRRLYNRELPNPLLGMTSRDFARVAAGVYSAHGIRVVMLPEEASTYISTPELSFAIRALEATAGLNISASHNHPDDNGGKFYNARGAQEVPPDDEAMARQVERVSQVSWLDFPAAQATGLLHWLRPEIHEAYVALNMAQSLQPTARRAHVVFTPLHGTANTTVGEVLRQAGFQVDVVAEQATPDGAFPAVPYRAPNPEVPESMQQGMALARTLGADAVFACDPDADRLGVCSRTTDGTYRFLTGNEIAVLTTHYKLAQLHQLGRLPARPLVIKTEVTTELLRPITEAFDGVLVGDLLVGFKYHAHVLDQVERHGHYGAFQGALSDFVMAVEESHGLLVTPDIRDKDAAGAALLLAELAACQRQRDATLLDYLDDIYRRYGYYANLGTSMVMTGAEGTANIQAIQQGLRQHPPTAVAGWAVTQTVDHWDEGGRHGPFLSETDRASRNVLAFRLSNGARVLVRPSGTEPKNKVYIEVPTPPVGLQAGPEALARCKAEANAVAQAIADDFTRQMLRIIHVQLPDYALRISGLVPLDKRLDFVERFMPGFEERTAALSRGHGTASAVSQWIDVQLASYGKDARGLVQDALGLYLYQERAKAGSGEAAAQRQRQLQVMESVFCSAAAV